MVDTQMHPPREEWLSPEEIGIAKIISADGVQDAEFITHDGTRWLVSAWFIHDEEGWMRPTRIVSLKSIRHQILGDRYLVVNEQIPVDWDKPAFPLETAKRARVIEQPNIFYLRKPMN